MSRKGSTSQLRKGRGERGTVIVETAMCLLFLMSLLVGSVELGLAWRTSVTNSNSARGGARVASYQGTSVNADIAALNSVGAGLKSVSLAQINRVIIFKATAGSSVVPATCLSAAVPSNVTSRSGVTGLCNVYSGAQVSAVLNNSLTVSKFGNGAGTAGACLATSLDASWCPNGRNNLQASASGPDYVGVYVETLHSTVTSWMGTSFNVKDTSIMRIEPSASGA